jgi:hypothetical protein
MCSASASGTAVLGISASGRSVTSTVDGETGSSWAGPSPARKPMLTATTRSSRPSTLNHTAPVRSPRASRRAMNGAEMPTAMSPSPAGSANTAGNVPSASAMRNATPITRNVCGQIMIAARGTASSATISAPPAAIAIHGFAVTADCRYTSFAARIALTTIHAPHPTAKTAARTGDCRDSPYATTAGIPTTPIKANAQSTIVILLNTMYVPVHCVR